MSSFLDSIDNSVRKMRKARISFCVARRKATEYQREEFKQWRYSEEAKVLVKEQLEKLGDMCPVCQQDLDETNATIDHLISLSESYVKAMDTSNFLVMCWPCNRRKSNSSFAKWHRRLHTSQKTSLNYAIRLIHGEAKLNELLNIK